METIEINVFNDLPFGENVNQTAYIAPIENGIEYKILTEEGNIEYVDYLNLSTAIEILAEFFDVNSAVLTKDNKICAVALGSSNEVALEKIIESDPLSLTGGTIAFSKEVNLEIIKQLQSMKIRNIIASNFTKEANDFLSKSNGLNAIQITSQLQEILGFTEKEIKLTPFGYLIQERNNSKLTKENFKVAGKTKPTQQQAEDAIFAWKIAKYTKSKTAIIAKDLSTKAIVQDSTNLIDAVEKAVDIACENSKDSVLSVDGTIDHIEVVNAAIQGRVSLIIEANDGIYSPEITKMADKYNITLIKTGIRNYKY